MKDTIERAKRALAEDVPEVDDVRRARLWANIESGRRERAVSRPWWLFAAPALAVAAALVLFLRSPEPTVAPPTGPQPIVHQVGGGQVSYFTARLGELTPRKFELLEGEATLELAGVEPLEPVLVDTPFAKIELLSGRAILRVGMERGTLTVEEGTARVTIDGKTTNVKAGETRTLERPAPVAVAPAPVVEKPKKRVVRRPAKTKPKPAPAPQPKADTKKNDEKVDRARRLVRREPRQAKAIAREVLETRPSPPVEARALMVLADAQRYDGNRTEAAKIYAKVIAMSAGADFHDEAVLRRAEQLAKLGDKTNALAALDGFEKRGPLQRERTALAVEIALDIEGPKAALARLEKNERLTGAAMARARVAVAKALLSSNPDAAQELAKKVIDDGAPASILDEAKSIEKR